MTNNLYINLYSFTIIDSYCINHVIVLPDISCIHIVS